MYETMRFWQDPPPDPPYARDYAEMWQRADKVVYSRTLEKVSSARTRIEREFDAQKVRELKRDAPRDITVGGAELAAQAIAQDLVDECQVFLHPVAVGGGKPALPPGMRVNLELLDQRRFESGVVFLHYKVPRSRKAG